jgi:hypothetical protein
MLPLLGYDPIKNMHEGKHTPLSSSKVVGTKTSIPILENQCLIPIWLFPPHLTLHIKLHARGFFEHLMASDEAHWLFVVVSCEDDIFHVVDSKLDLRFPLFERSYSSQD